MLPTPSSEFVRPTIDSATTDRSVTTSADGWFAIRPITATIFCLSEALGDQHPRFGPITTNSYLIVGTERAALIDAGFGIGDLHAAVRELTQLPIELCLSHAHWDHYGSAAQFDNIAVGAADGPTLEIAPSAQMQAFVAGVPDRCRRPMPTEFSFAGWGPPIVTATRLLSDGDVIELGGRSLTAIPTPGHTPGSTCYLDHTSRILFTGDTVMRADMHVDLEGGDGAAFTQSLQRLRGFDDYDAICPAHFATPLPRSFLERVADYCLPSTGSGSAPADFDVVGLPFIN